MNKTQFQSDFMLFFTRCAQNEQDAFPFGKTALDTAQQF